MPPQLVAHALIAAAMTFPVGTGLGWDGIHPRAICRLSYDTLLWIAEVIHLCEVTGIWPIEVDIVVIAPVPKIRWRPETDRAHAVPAQNLVQSQEGGND